MSRMIIRASLAIIVTDGLTGKPVSHPRVRLDGCAPGLRKSDGCRVFLNLAPSFYTAVIEAPFYQTRVVPIRVGAEFILHRIALVPGRQFPFPQTVLWESGPHPEGAEMVALEEDPPLFRIVEPAAAGAGQITLYDSGGSFAARQVWIRTRDGAGTLFWITPNHKEQNRYDLDHPLPWPADTAAQILPVLPAPEGPGACPVFPSCRTLHWLDGNGRLISSQERKGVN